MDAPRWPAEWLRSALSGAVLSIVSEGETYGYEIAQRLADGGMGVVKGGTLYPLLARLEQDGDVTATWREGTSGPGRKYYALTEAGTVRLEAHRRDWAAFTEASTAIIMGTRGTS